MHLQFNLSNQVIKQWKPTLTENPPEAHPLLLWRIDKVKLDRTTVNYICVNEATLFSFLLPQLPGEKPLEVQQFFVNRLRVLLDSYFFPSEALGLFDQLAVCYGKTDSRSVIGIVNDMRFQYQIQYEMQTELLEAELRVNTTPYQSPNGRFPLEEFLKLRLLFKDKGDRFFQLKMPEDLVYAARRALPVGTVIPALLCFNREKDANGMLTAELPIDDLVVFQGCIEDTMEESASEETMDRLEAVSDYLMNEMEKWIGLTDENLWL